MDKFNNPFTNFFNQQGSAPKSPEQTPSFEAGEYNIKVTYINYKGEEVTRSLDFPLRSESALSKEGIEKRASGEIVFFGLHNWGMDVYIKNYPNGHPVTVRLYRGKDNTPVHTFVQKFDGSGKVVK